jgi:hypothetical protein
MSTSTSDSPPTSRKRKLATPQKIDIASDTPAVLITPIENDDQNKKRQCMDISWAQLALERLISLQMAAAVVGDLGRYTTDTSGVEEIQNQEDQDDANSIVSTSSDPNQLESTGHGVLIPSPCVVVGKFWAAINAHLFK